MRKGWNLRRSDYAVIADVFLPGLLAVQPAISEIVNKLMNLGLPINPSVQSNTKFPNTVSIIVTNIYSFWSKVIFTICINQITHKIEKW
jgi:hypothetical protein